MSRLHPAVAEVRRAVRTALSDLPPGECVLAACSGGADSLALAAALAFEGRSAGWRAGAVVVDHRLQLDSAAVAARAAQTLGGLGLQPVEVVTVGAGSAAGGPEAAARRARYAGLEEVGRRHEATVVLGHTREDQAETVLLGLARGSGIRSLAGMAPRRGRFRRPLLDVSRDVTRAACEAQALPVWDDPHNDDPRFARSRVRRSVLPLLEEALGPGVVVNLARTASAARLDSDLLDALTEPLADDARGARDDWDVGVLTAAPRPLRRRVLLRAAREAGCPASELFAVHVDALERLLTHWHGQGPIELPGGVRAGRRADRLVLSTGPAPPSTGAP